MQAIWGEMTYGVSQQLADLYNGNQGSMLGAEIARRSDSPFLVHQNGQNLLGLTGEVCGQAG